MKKYIYIFTVLFSCFYFSTYAQVPVCQDYFYQSGMSGCIYRLEPGVMSYTSQGPALPGNASGLAIGPSLSFNAPNPTYWTVNNGTYHYYNGSTFINTGHSAGGSGFTNPGAGANYIFNVNSNGEVSRYDGTGPAVVIATLSAYSLGFGFQDIVGDQNNNFYLLRYAQPACLSVFNSNAVFTCSYSATGLSGDPYSQGFAISANKVHVLQGWNSYRVGTVSGSTINFSVGGVLGCQPEDFANCPATSLLAPPITDGGSSAISCLNPTITLSSNDVLNVNTYTWTGPGIVSAASGQSIAVNLPGVYSRTLNTCAGLVHVTSHTVTTSSAYDQPVLNASDSVKCRNGVPVTLTAGAMANYTWAPAASLSSAVGGSVLASPSITTIYTVTGSLNNCTGTSTIMVKSLPDVPPVIVPSNSMICAGASVTLNSGGFPQMNWQPGGQTGGTIVVSPASSVVYSLTGTNALGCSESATIAITVIDYPSLSTTVSSPTLCSGNNVVINSGGAANYDIQPGSLAGASVQVTPLVSTVYTVQGSNWNCSVSKTVAVTVFDLPQVSVVTNNSLICTGEPAILTASGALDYSWSTQDSAASIVVNPLFTTTYSVIGTNAEGCSKISLIQQVVSECTDISEAQKDATFDLYPNPSKDIVYITLNNQSSGFDLRVTDVLGKIVLEQICFGPKTQLDVSSLKNGVYYVQVSELNQLKGRRLLVVE